jgi:hypothetical protein
MQYLSGPSLEKPLETQTPSLVGKYVTRWSIVYLLHHAALTKIAAGRRGPVTGCARGIQRDDSHQGSCYALLLHSHNNVHHRERWTVISTVWILSHSTYCSILLTIKYPAQETVFPIWESIIPFRKLTILDSQSTIPLGRSNIQYSLLLHFRM